VASPFAPPPLTARADFTVSAPDTAGLRPRVCGFVFAHRAEVEAFWAATAEGVDVLRFRIAAAPAWSAAVWGQLELLAESLGGRVARDRGDGS